MDIQHSPSVVGTHFEFGDFQMDVARYRLSKGQREISLRPKSWDVLFCLIKRPRVLVTKEALRQEVWPDIAISDDALTKRIVELRRALGDTRRTPRFIETVHGRGFRFVGEVREVENETPAAARAVEPGVRFVGRHAELRRLHECLRMARQGERQLVFITGEAGIGKTTLLEEFLRSPSVRGPDLHVLHGQCIQQHGQREPYMPVLEALERTLSSPEGAPEIPLFRRAAPCWCMQISWLLSDAEPAGLQGAMMSAPPERMLREIGAFLESWATRATIVIVLEDFHWSDERHRGPVVVSAIASRSRAAPHHRNVPSRRGRHARPPHPGGQAGRCGPVAAASTLRSTIPVDGRGS